MIQLPPLFRGSDHRRAATGVQSDASSFRRRPERPAGDDKLRRRRNKAADANQHANRPHTPLCHARSRPKNSLDRSQVQSVMGRINIVDAGGDGRKAPLLVPNEPLTLAGKESFGFPEVLGGSAGWLSPATLAIVPGNLFFNERKRHGDN